MVCLYSKIHPCFLRITSVTSMNDVIADSKAETRGKTSDAFSAISRILDEDAHSNDDDDDFFTLSR